MQLTPAGLRMACSSRVTAYDRSSAPRTTMLAGALCTPRLVSVRAQVPAMWPDGAMVTRVPVMGFRA